MAMVQNLRRQPVYVFGTLVAGLAMAEVEASLSEIKGHRFHKSGRIITSDDSREDAAARNEDAKQTAGESKQKATASPKVKSQVKA